ncbi:hypothetical protein [Falsiroseomonas tokyonensis]|uniref:Uncharacterized protein n=1 Tax=Falsiroseomonas tokyonensis TaxID=430521 RepID=A0ABV7BUJ4_9PROT|nr:hypothetical protein [Falsiroseomonas tokyonensis]MBU8539277.1 hypothetical protein [Falsiroseomonas tokyonensis]
MPQTFADLPEDAEAALAERPASFAERGCAVPFTAPQLRGARLRRGAGGQAELLLPARDGRGMRVLRWEDCLRLCAPTLHDRQLWDRVAAQGRPTPALMRATAREVARLGYAGRSAQAAAFAALRQQDQVREAVREALSAHFEALEPEAAELLVPMVAILAQTGMGPALRPQQGATIPRVLVALDALGRSLAAFAQLAPSLAERRAAAITLGAARMTLPVAEACLRMLWQAVEDLPGRLATGELRRVDVLPMLADLASRADWLLDGWPRVTALWDAAQPAGRGAVLAELVGLLPVPPLEAAGWPGARGEWDTLLRARRAVSGAQSLAEAG